MSQSRRVARHFAHLAAIIASIAVTTTVLAADAPDAGKVAPFRAGAAMSDITPFLGGAIVGGWGEPKSQRIHDDLHARCLVIDDGKTRLAFVICDNVGISREVFDEARRLVSEATALAPQNLLLASTHTHSATSAGGPSLLQPKGTRSDYQNFLTLRIVDAVRNAIANLEPARIGWGSINEPRPLFNRRYKMKPGTELLNPFGGTDLVQMNPGINNPAVLEPAGPTDPQISFISVKSVDGRPIALLANYSLHYVGGVGGHDISADYFAMFADRVQQLLGADRLDPPFVGIMTNGTSGDVNNIDVLGPKLPKRKDYEQMRLVADIVADDVAKAHASIEFHDRVALFGAQRELKLKTRKPTPEMVDRAKKLLSKEITPDKKRPHEEAYAGMIVEMADVPDEIAVLLQTFRIGDLGIAAIPFEVFTQSGLDIKARSPLRPTFTIELANGSFGYLPTPEQHALGGYETWLGSNRVEVQASTRIVETLMQMFDALK